MKQIKILILLLTGIIIFDSCRKSDNPKLPALTQFPLPLILKVPGTDQVISAQNPSAFTGKFTVDLYFKNDVPPKQYDVVVMKNGNTGNVKTLQANIATFPTTITVTGPQLATLFGAPIVVGDKFDISVDVTTQDGTKYLGFPATGASYAAGIAAEPGSSTLIRYEAVCQYDPNIYQGNFVVVTDDWADYNPGDIVPLTKIDATHFSFKYGAFHAKPIVVTVDPNTNAVTVAKQVYGDYGNPPAWPYGDISAQSVPSVDDFVAPCQGIFSVVLQHTVAAGSFGQYKIVLKKQ